MYQKHGTYCIKVKVCICFRSSNQFFCSALTITILSIFSQFRMLQFLWQSNTASPTSSLKYLICANSPILITSHSVNTTLEYGAGTVK